MSLTNSVESLPSERGRGTEKLRPLMVLGCTSDAGKSLLTAALCRWFARQGVDVAPFKAQNMSNNARVVDGGEIGLAQWLQAGAAGVMPTVAMNPVLIKPEGDTRSQVILSGRAAPEVTEMPWEHRSSVLWPAMTRGFAQVEADHELVLLEGAGSPAEINLVDLVNNRMLHHVDGAALLVSDIDRGGAFAHLVGTHALAPSTTQDRLAGFVLNKFRGDQSLLAPAPEYVTRTTGMASVGVLPMMHHELPDEEGATVRATPPSGAPIVAIPRLPFGSNVDEFHLLGHVAAVRFSTTAQEIEAADLVILPGSKHVASDLAWLRSTGQAEGIKRRVAAGNPVLGICGGCQMVGESINDPDGVEGRFDGEVAGRVEGLDLLPLRTDFVAEKLTAKTEMTLPTLPGRWAALSGCVVEGYEIRNGRTSIANSAGTGSTVVEVQKRVFASDTVLATTIHGLLESPDVLERLFGIRPAPVLEQTYEELADAVEEHLDTDFLRRVVGV